MQNIMCSDQTRLELLKNTGASKDGHFMLTSGKHCAQYLQISHLFEDPKATGEVCNILAKAFEEDKIDIVIGPAIGGIIVAYELARVLGVKAIFSERSGGSMKLRRGFSIKPGQRVLIAEDEITTGGSIREVAALVESFGGEVVGVASVINHGNERPPIKYKKESFVILHTESYEPEDCPLCKAGIPLE